MSKALQLSDDEAIKLGERLCDQIKQADTDRLPYIQQIERNRLLLKSYQPIPPKEKAWKEACELVIHYCKETIYALLSHHAPSLLGVNPIWMVQGKGTANRGMADEMERFMQEQATKQIEVRERLEPAFHAALEDGVAILHIGWRHEERKRPFWEQVEQVEYDPESGEVTAQPGEVREGERMMEVYDGPHLELMPIEDAGCFPAAWSDFQTSSGFYMRRSLMGDELLQRSTQGVFDAGAVAKLREAAVFQAKPSPDDVRRGITAAQAGERKFHSSPHTITDCYVRYVASENQVAEDWLVTVHEDTRILLRAKRTPWWYPKRPVVVFRPFPDKYSQGMGDSIPDLAGDVQRAKTTLIRLAVDSMALGIAPELLVGQSGGPKLIREIQQRRGPRGVIPVPDQYLDKVKPFSPGYVPTVAIPLFETLHDEGERATGVGDLSLGKQTPGETTAYEVSQLFESAQRLVSLQVERFSRSLSEVGRIVYALDYQFQGHESIQRLWQMANPDSQIAVFQAFQGDYDLTAAGLSETANRAIRAKRALERLTLLRQHPAILSDPRRHYQLYYDTLMETGTREPERFIGTEMNWINLYQQMREAQQAEANAQAAAGAEPGGQG